MPGLVPVEAVLLLLLLFVAGGASARSLAQPSEAFDPSGLLHVLEPQEHTYRELQSAVAMQRKQPTEQATDIVSVVNAVNPCDGQILKGLRRQLAAPADAAGEPSSRPKALPVFQTTQTSCKEPTGTLDRIKGLLGGRNPSPDPTPPLSSPTPSQSSLTPTPTKPAEPAVSPSLGPKPAAPVASKQAADTSRTNVGPARLQEWKDMLSERRAQRQRPSPSALPTPTSPMPSPIPSPSPNPAPSPNPSPSPLHRVVLPPHSPSPSPAPPVSPSPSPPAAPSPSPASPSPSPSPPPEFPSPSASTLSPSPSPPPKSPSPSPVPYLPDPPAPSAGVIAGAVMGAVGGLALILAATWLIRHCKHRRSRRSKSTWEDRDALGPLYTVGSAKDPSSRFFPQIVHSPSSKHSGRTAAAAAAPAPAAAGDVAPVLDTGRGAMALGFTGDELQAGLSDLKHVVTNRLLPAVDSSPLQTDVVVIWLDAGMASVRSHSSNGRDYTASHTFVDDWRTHRMWDWLNNRYWRHVPTNKRLMHVQAPAQATLSQLSYARYTLNQINQDPHFKPFADAVDAAVAAMLQDAAALAASTGAVLPTTTGSSGNSGCAYPDLPMSYDGSGAASRQTQQAAVAAAYAYYQPVLRELCEAALRYHLQVQGTAEGMFIFVPGAVDVLQVPVPSEGLVVTRRPGGVREVCMCSRPGVLSTDARGAGGLSVWVPAYAVSVVPQ